MTEPEMDLNTAADLVESFRTRMVVPFEKLADVIRLARDSKNQVVADTKRVAELEAHLLDLAAQTTAAETAAQVAQEEATAVSATAERDAQAAVQRANEAKAAAVTAIATLEAEFAARREQLEAEHTERASALTEQRNIAQALLDGLKLETATLRQTILQKFAES